MTKYILAFCVFISFVGSILEGGSGQDAASMIGGGTLAAVVFTFCKNKEYAKFALFGALASGVGYGTYYLAQGNLPGGVISQWGASIVTAAVVGVAYTIVAHKGYNGKIKKGDFDYDAICSDNNKLILAGAVAGAITGAVGLGVMQLVSRFLPSVVSLTTSATK